jgi:hypothetical protein
VTEISAPGAADLVYAGAFLGGSILWAILYYRLIDPVLRAMFGALCGRHIVWAFGRQTFNVSGTIDPAAQRWGWWTKEYDSDEGSLWKLFREESGAAAVAFVGALVIVVAGVLPWGVLALSLFVLHTPAALVAYVLAFVYFAIWGFYWSGLFPHHNR